MVWRTMSTIHPRRSFRVSQAPSPFRSFLRETALHSAGCRTRLEWPGRSRLPKEVSSHGPHAPGSALTQLDEVVDEDVSVR